MPVKTQKQGLYAYLYLFIYIRIDGAVDKTSGMQRKTGIYEAYARNKAGINQAYANQTGINEAYAHALRKKVCAGPGLEPTLLR